MALFTRISKKASGLLKLNKISRPTTTPKQSSLTPRRYHTEVVIRNIAKSTVEGPVWLSDQKSLLFVDALDGDIHLWISGKDKLQTVNFPTFTTFCIPHEKGGFVASLGQKIIHFDWNDHLNYKTLAEVDHGKPTRLVDGKCDKFGRLFCGTMGLEFRPAVPVLEQGSLYSLDTHNKLRIWDTKLHIANSMVWSPDYTTLYLTESIPGFIYAYDYDLETGSLSNRRIVIYLPHTEHGVLDRMTVDTDGNLWTAYYGGGKVTQIDPRKGQIVREIKMDCPTVTCVCFGGEKLDELYVTSSSYEQNMEENPLAGSVFRITGLGVKGLEPHYYNGK